MKKIGYILSGGGARSIAHLGIVKALEEEGLKPHKMAGTSAGAVIAVLYASGMKPQEIFELIQGLKLWSIISPVIPKDGLSGMGNLEKLLNEHLPVKRFEELQIPVSINATDIAMGVSICFSKGELVKPLLATCCLPVLFKPVTIGNKSFVDGGIINNLPVDLINEDVDFTIGMHSNPIFHDFEPSGMKSMIERTFLMAISCNVYSRKHLCDVFIEPPLLGTYKVLDFNKGEEIFNIGYQYAKDNMHTFGLEKIKNKDHDISGTNTSRNT